MQTRIPSLLLTAALTLACHRDVSATILSFDISDPAFAGSENFPEGFQIDQVYGDRVTGTLVASGTSTFGYGLGSEGFTPNVVVGYGPGSIFTGGPSLWRYDYGDLTRVLYQGSTFTGVGFDYDYLLIDLVADPGFLVQLYGFDLGGWFQTDYVINGVAVYDNFFNGFFPENNRIFYDDNATVAGAGPAHSSYTFSTPLQGSVITILIDANNLGSTSELVGIDNIRFGQVEATAVPEPGTLALAGCGIAGFISLRLRKRRR
jgi:hypothetical protein